jgi:hypothetical protein
MASSKIAKNITAHRASNKAAGVGNYANPLAPKTKAVKPIPKKLATKVNQMSQVRANRYQQDKLASKKKK